ncbi:type IV secretion system protein B10 [Roseivivax halodurans JCM 10272]|uniref:Type IV secretion system protein B10 n=1 Tax=Roseivivax halodurans JCM 10272 TaxID=1449350 RepID=X7EE79_9RHOB|nr:TrbI/VirB10 family protein [Roseivivax halodurans]ETX13511.1 type IV secretion system protein B10 [Roseivivax halodurans JCM 10272]
MAEDPDLQKRLETFSASRQRRPGRGINITLLALMLGLGGAGIAYVLAVDWQEARDALRTSDVEPFQDDRPETGGGLEFPEEEAGGRIEDALIAIEDALVPPPAAPEPAVPSAEILAELQRLRDALAASQAERNAQIQSAVGELRAAFGDQTRSLEAAVAERDERISRLERENETRLNSLEAMLEAERAQREALEAERADDALIRDLELLEERRRQEAEEQRLEAERQATELLSAQIRSPAVVYSAGSSTGSADVASGAEGARASPSLPLEADEAYLRRGARALEIDEATRMETPERTLAQGTVIQAALQTAINSDLPGNVVAVVAEPVYGFAGDRVLVPKGARLFGQYRSGIDVNQKRILVLWTRILTPEGISMEIAAVGGDPLGRSGLTGLVDTKFDERFGGAALISIIGAAPAVAANSAEDEITGDVLAEIGSGLEEATGSVIADQVSISPTIYVDQGAMVTVLVDRDIVIF